MNLIILILVIPLLLVGGFGYGYRSSIYSSPYYTGGYGIIGLILVFVLILALLGRL